MNSSTNTPGSARDLNAISGQIVDAAYSIHTEVGPGLLETVYVVTLAEALRKNGLSVEREVSIPIQFRGKIFQEGFRADLVVGGTIIVEVKSVAQLARVHAKTLLTYLRLSSKPLGLLINFGGDRLKGNIERIVNGPVSDLKNAGEKHRPIAGTDDQNELVL